MKKSLTGSLVICSLCLGAVPAEAQESDADPVEIILYISEVPVVSLGVSAAVANLVSIAKGERASSSWRVMGWVSAVLNGGLGTYCVLAHSGNDILYALGLTNLALGVLDAGFTLWSSLLPERKKKYYQRFSLGPMILPDARGKPAFGVGLRLLDW